MGPLLPETQLFMTYRRKVAKRGIEARLCAPMIAGVGFAIGCFIFGFSSLRTVHWIVPCIGLTILLSESQILHKTK